MKIKNKKILVGILIISTILLIMAAPITYAKYIQTGKLNFIQKVANPVFVIDEGETAKIDVTNNIGYYEFSIKNYDEEKISDVGFLYTIEIISDINEPVQFELYNELYNEEKQIPLENLTTNKLVINGNEKIEQKYKLKIIYDINNLTEETTERFSKVHIRVHSEQEKI